MEISRTASLAIGVLGVLFGIGGGVAYVMRPDSVVLYTTLEGIAAVHLIVFFITHFEVLKAVSRKRSTVLGFNTVLMTVVVIAILGMINFIVVQHEVRVDLSGRELYTLSPQTLTVLKGIKEKVKLSGFFQQGSPQEDQAREIFENYRHQNSRMEYAFIDPDRQPAVVKQYGVTSYNTVVVESQGQSTMITASLSEQELTSALIRMSRTSKKQIYFIEGHGEHLLENTDRGGYSFLKTSLENQGYAVKRLILLSETDIPSDATVVVMGGPETAYAPEEEAMLRRYLSKKGQLLALLDPMTKNNMEVFFAEWGVVLNQEIILDPSSGLGPAVPIVDAYLPHEITRDFQMATFYSLAQAVALNPDKGGDIRFDSFVQTRPQSWATKNKVSPISLDPNRDRKGPIVLGGVFSQKLPVSPEATPAEAASKAGMRLVVMGDSDFATNGLIRAVGNGDFVQNIISWLAQEKDLVSIRPKDFPLEALLLTGPQQAGIFYLSVVFFPIAVLVMGLLVYRKRRRL